MKRIAIVTHSDSFALKIRLLHNHGRKGKDNHITFGRDSKMDNVQAVVLDEKLKQIDALVEKRRRDASVYDRELVNTKSLSTITTMGESSYYQYVVTSENRDQLQ